MPRAQGRTGNAQISVIWTSKGRLLRHRFHNRRRKVSPVGRPSKHQEAPLEVARNVEELRYDQAEAEPDERVDDGYHQEWANIPRIGRVKGHDNG